MIRIVLASLLIVFGAAANAAPKCAPVSLAASGGSKPFAAKSSAFRTTAANFAKAYSKACAGGLLEKRPLPSRLFLLNAPNANIASIYKSGGRMVLEYPFLDSDRRTHVPDAAELHEAIFCSVHGASQKEQEESGRCLPD
jgi:hypothetical protein